jgi:hypothetical protein
MNSIKLLESSLFMMDKENKNSNLISNNHYLILIIFVTWSVVDSTD